MKRCGSLIWMLLAVVLVTVGVAVGVMIAVHSDRAPIRSQQQMPRLSDRLEPDYGLACSGEAHPNLEARCSWVGRVDAEVIWIVSGALLDRDQLGSIVDTSHSGVWMMNISQDEGPFWFSAPDRIGPLRIRSVKKDVLRLSRSGSTFFFDVARERFQIGSDG